MNRKCLVTIMATAMMIGVSGCGQTSQKSTATTSSQADGVSTKIKNTAKLAKAKVKTYSGGYSSYSQKYIEKKLNLANNSDQKWTYDSSAKAWTMSPTAAVAYPEVPDEEGVSVCVPAAYVKGIDTNADGKTDKTAKQVSGSVKGSLVINYNAKVTSTNGQVYTAKTAPVILNTGAAGYSAQSNQNADSTYSSEGYINVACGNRGKQSTAKNKSGKKYYTGDAPSCLVDQKCAARFVRYNILLGNLPGSSKYLVSTGGSGGGAHASMFAATSNHSDFYDYQIAVGAVGVYADSKGNYSTKVTINGKKQSISDGAWGCIAYSAITPLAEADMDLAFEYTLDSTYDFNTSFQKQVAKYLSQAYMSYINKKNLTIKESAIGLDINGDGDQKDTISLKIHHSSSKYQSTNGYYGTYLDLYLAKFKENLTWYLENLDYANDWTWFNQNGKALSDAQVKKMTATDKAEAFLKGRYAKSSSSDQTSGSMPGGMKVSNNSGKLPSGTPPSGTPAQGQSSSNGSNKAVGTPDAGTTQASGSSTDSSNYKTYAKMLKAYQKDIKSVNKGDDYGRNIVQLYNPLNYIGAKGTSQPQWTRIMMGASEGDMSLFASMNMQLAWLNAGTNSVVEWQWDGGHVPSEILGESFSLYVDEMYGKYVKGAKKISKPAATKQTKNGSATSATGTNISSWASYSKKKGATFTLAKAAAYRSAGASKAIPGFDVMDYGQEDYEFGNSTKDARHWSTYVLKVFENHQQKLKSLYNKSKS